MRWGAGIHAESILGRAFVADTRPERFAINRELEILFPESGLKTTVTVRHIRMWGEGHAPGFGVSFNHLDNDLETMLASIIDKKKTAIEIA